MISYRDKLFIFITPISILFTISFGLAVLSGIDPITSLLWSTSGILGVYYPSLINYSLGIHNPYLAAGDALLAISYALMTALSATLFFNFIKNVNIYQKSMIRKIKKLKNHIIIVPFNSFSETVMAKLDHAKVKYVVITANEKDAKHLYKKGKLVIVGDTNSIDVLDAAGLPKSNGIILCSEDPTFNSLTAITVRTFNKHIHIVSRVNNEEDLPKLSRSGIRKLVLPEISAGIDLSNVILKQLNIKSK